MGPPRKYKEKCNQLINSTNKNNSPRSVRKKTNNSTEENGNVYDQPKKFKSQKNSSNNNSVFNYLNNISYGDNSKPVITNFRKNCIVNYLSELDDYKTVIQFETRVTAIEWHPNYPEIFAAGSKEGELYFLNLLSSSSIMIPGIGPEDTILALKFTLDDHSSVFTTSTTGKIRRQCFYDETGEVLLCSEFIRKWFTSLDVFRDKKMILAGDNKGKGILLASNRREKIWPQFKCLHKDKISHIEVCPLDSDIVATASIDHTVKIWDLRMISGSDDKPNPVHTLNHLKGVNSVYFSPSNRNALLTTDQKNEIRVYKSPGWTEELVIAHPHRHFPHMTAIKATWHPFEDIIVVGRYPDENFKQSDTRTIDYFDGSTGDLLQRNRSITGGVTSLNAFNITGDYLASASGSSISFKAGKEKLDKFSEIITDD